jgi:hypothetical protein
MTGWSLVPVVYEEVDQRRILERLFDQIQSAAVRLLETFGATADVVEKIESTVGHLLADVTFLLAPCFKDPSFAAEEEWRIFKTRLEGEGIDDDPLPLKFRGSASQVVPYAEFAFAPRALKAAVLGYQVPEHPVKQSLRLLLKRSGVDPGTIEITRSTVPARGTA